MMTKYLLNLSHSVCGPRNCHLSWISWGLEVIEFCKILEFSLLYYKTNNFRARFFFTNIDGMVTVS